MEKIDTYIFPLPDINNYHARAESNFIGRTSVQNNFYSAIKHSLKRGGSFLVGGYRGVGKTTLVNNQVEKLRINEFEKRTVLVSKLDLGVNWDLSPREILCDISEEFTKSFSVYSSRMRRLAFAKLFIFTVICIVGYYLYGPIEYCLNSVFDGDRALSWWVKIPLFGVGGALLVFYCFTFLWALFNLILFSSPYLNILKVSLKLQRFNERIRYSRVFHGGVETSTFGIKLSHKTILSEDPISLLRIEQELIGIFNYIASKKFPSDEQKRFTGMKSDRHFIQKVKRNYHLTKITKTRIQPIIIFDELDKISVHQQHQRDTENDKKMKIDSLLGGLKSLLTSSRSTFIFISGREMVDAYHSESGNTSALYEGLFKDIFYIPTLLGDSSDGQKHKLHSMIEQYIANILCWDPDLGPTENASIDNYVKQAIDLSMEDDGQVIKYHLNLFIYFLTLHSWGNCKRLITLLGQFLNEHTEENKHLVISESTFIAGGSDQLKIGTPYLMFNDKQLQRIYVSAKVYTMFDNAIGASISRTDDKLIVSTLITILDILKFYSRGFSRDMLDRTVEGISMHSEANLPNMVDNLLSTVFYPTIRKTADSLFDYRFFSVAEEEIRYISKSVGARASSFEFALDSSNPVRSFLQKERNIHSNSEQESFNSYITRANIEIYLGDLCSSERVYDTAYFHYGAAVQLLKRVLRDQNGENWRSKGGASISSHYLLVCTLLKKGLIDELRGNMQQSLRNYREAENLSMFSLEILRPGLSATTTTFSSSNEIHIPADYESWMLVENDTKGVRHFGMLIHSVLAIDFLQLKSSKRPSSLMFQNVKQYNPGKTEPNLFSKILLLNYFGGATEEIVEQNLESARDIIERLDSEDGNPHEISISFIVAQSLFCHTIKKFCPQTPRSSDEYREKRSKETYVEWLNLICFLCGQSVTDLYSIKSWNKEEDFSKDNIWLSFQMIFILAKRSENEGLFIRASQLYQSILTNWIAILESVPWTLIDDHHDEVFKDLYSNRIKREKYQLEPTYQNLEKIKTTSKWIDEVIRRMEDSLEKGNQGAFHNERAKYPTAPGQYSDRSDVFRLSSISTILDDSTPSISDQAIITSPLIWYRSAQENYLLYLILWEKQSRKIIASKIFDHEEYQKSSFPCHPIDSLPKITSGYHWLRARDISFFEKTKDEKGDIDISYYLDILENYWHALVYLKGGARSEESDSIPPKALIYYGMFYEIQSLSKENMAALRHSRLTMESAKYEFPLKYLSYTYLHRNCRKQFGDLANVIKLSSNAFRRKFHHKYYLYDDFDDYTFIGEWAYSIALSQTAGPFIDHVNKANTGSTKTQPQN